MRCRRRVSRACAPLRPSRSSLRAIADLLERGAEALGEIVAFGDEPRGAGRDHRLGVARLVIVDRVRKRHEHRRHAGGREFGERQRARAADDEIGPRVSRGHVVDERLDVRFDARACTPRAPSRNASRRTGGAHRPASRGRDGAALPAARIEALRALAAAEHEQLQRTVAARVALAGGGSAAIARAPDCRPIRRAEMRRRIRSARAVAKCASMRLVTPGTRFCSCTTSGTRASHAAMPPGPAAKPPSDSTLRGAWRFSIARAATIARKTQRRRAACAGPCRARRRCQRLDRKPACGTSRVSRPPRCRARAPASRRRSSCATAMPGKIWPPVPPAMISTGDRASIARSSRTRRAGAPATACSAAFSARATS